VVRIPDLGDRCDVPGAPLSGAGTARDGHRHR
jgi:hypothetical protein